MVGEKTIIIRQSMESDNWAESMLARYPNVYAQGMYFEIGEGWHKLVEELSAKLEPMIIAYEADEYFGKPYCVQCKEKFGGLRFYMDRASDGMYKVIDEAEGLSELTCESCGEPGHIRKGSWIRTLCDGCVK